MTSSACTERASRPVPLSFGLVVFGTALLLNLHVFIRGWEQNLLGFHQFREIQTAITSYYYLQDGYSLDYLTPVLGPPWQIILELPLFQASAAMLSQVTGLALEPAGRLASWLYFLSALPAGYLLLGRFRLTPAVRFVFLALLLLSPIYVYFSRLFMIESTAMAAGLWFLLAFSRVVEDRRFGWLPVVWLAGSLAGGVKITTWAVFLVAAGILFLKRWWNDPKLATRDGRMLVGLAALALIPPFAASLGWTWHAKAMRALSPETGFLDAHFGYWSFGDLAQRTSWDFWHRTSRVWVDEIVGEAGMILVVAGLGWLRGARRRATIACVLVFLSGQMVFSNLYWVHDYYFYASALFLVAALGFCFAEMLEHPGIPAWAGRIVVAVFLVLQLGVFERSFEKYMVADIPVPPLPALVAEITKPDEMIVVFGLDWDSALPYYSGRKALMMLHGREDRPIPARASIDRLDPAQVAAVVIVGPHQNNLGLVQGPLGSLQLGTEALLSSCNISIWIPQYRQKAVRARFNAQRFPTFQLAPEAQKPEGQYLAANQINERDDFAVLSPRPVQAYTRIDFARCEVEGQTMLLAHSTSEFVFDLPEGATRVSGSFGLSPASYVDGNATDGIELTVSHRLTEAGVERRLLSRVLDPMNQPADRGMQSFEVPLHGQRGQLVIRILPGPGGSASWDWSYIGNVRIQ